MLDFNLTSLTETNRILRQIAEALERAYPVPDKPAAKKPRTVEDLMTTNDETLASIEDEEERKRAVMEEKD